MNIRCLQLYIMIQRPHLLKTQLQLETEKISDDPYQFFVASLYSNLFVSIFPDAVVTNIHHVALVVLGHAHGQPGGPLELAAVRVDHRQELALRQVIDLQHKNSITSLLANQPQDNTRSSMSLQKVCNKTHSPSAMTM